MKGEKDRSVFGVYLLLCSPRFQNYVPTYPRVQWENHSNRSSGELRNILVVFIWEMLDHISNGKQYLFLKFDRKWSLHCIENKESIWNDIRLSALFVFEQKTVFVWMIGKSIVYIVTKGLNISHFLKNISVRLGEFWIKQLALRLSKRRRIYIQFTPLVRLYFERIWIEIDWFESKYKFSNGQLYNWHSNSWSESGHTSNPLF